MHTRNTNNSGSTLELPQEYQRRIGKIEVLYVLQSLLETEVCDDSSKASQSPKGNLRKKHPHPYHTLTPRQSERTLSGMGESTTSNKSTSSKSKKLGGIGNFV